MSQERPPETPASNRPERRGPPPNPLEHALFLPVLIVGMGLWFFWDGFINTDPKMMEHRTFNQIGFAVTAAISVWLVPRRMREWREEKAEAEAKAQRDRSSVS